MLLLKCSILLAILLPCLAMSIAKLKEQLNYGREAEYPATGNAHDPNTSTFAGFKDQKHNGTKRLSKSGRIVDVSPIESFPWQASIQEYDAYYGERWHVCGAFILNERWVGTAAYCVDDVEDMPEQILVFSGSNDLRDNGYLSSVHQIVVHSRFDYYTYQNDIAWVKLEHDLDLTEKNRRAIAFPAQDEALPRKKLEVSGWGKIYNGGPSTEMLQSVKLRSVAMKRCRAIYEEAFDIPDINEFLDHTKTCAGDAERNACYGDYGDALVKKTRTSALVIGIVSDVYVCGEYNNPGIYTKMSEFSDLTACVIAG